MKKTASWSDRGWSKRGVGEEKCCPMLTFECATAAWNNYILRLYGEVEYDRNRE